MASGGRRMRVNIRKPCKSLPTAMVGTRSRAIRRGTSRSSFSASLMAAHACTPDMAFVRVYGRATPDRAGARPYHGIDLIPYVDARGRPPDRSDACFKISETKQIVLKLSSPNSSRISRRSREILLPQPASFKNL